MARADDTRVLLKPFAESRVTAPVFLRDARKRTGHGKVGLGDEVANVQRQPLRGIVPLHH